jgi:N-acetyl-alpha-D-glucosaminyl L-malate synthase BshA
MNIGIVCYASVGGSGVVATELAHALAQRGHEVHLISSDLPFRWRSGVRGLSFERVDTPAYPLFRHPEYLLALTNTIVRLARRRSLDIVHAHYAVPHATAAYLAHQILSTSRRRRSDDGEAALGARLQEDANGLRTVTTLHGTDITLVGSDHSYRQVVAFSIEQSHGVTAVSESLKRDTLKSLAIERDVRVIPNFLDCTGYRRLSSPALREYFCPTGIDEALVVHVSNFRPVKRVRVVFEIFRRIRAEAGARLVMIGDGPDRADLEREVADQGFSDVVDFVGEQPDLVPWLSAADVFLLPSSQESFGMAALEAMACELPVVASRIGGLPEVIEDGVTGYLCELNDVETMAQRAVALIRDPSLRERIGRAAAEHVRTYFCEDIIVPLYEKFYEEVIRKG